jgi:tetratricopeptide (TPR) repeat protein
MMVGDWIGSVPDTLALVARRGQWWRLSWSVDAAHAELRPPEFGETAELTRRQLRARYYLGRGRRAREAAHYEQGALQARRALALNPTDPWAFALLGQCLSLQDNADLSGARRALERAWSLDPSNGYFVRLLLDVLDAQGDAAARNDLLAWAWWRGAPVQRWLPDGPPMPAPETRPTPSHAVSTPSLERAPARVATPAHA